VTKSEHNDEIDLIPLLGLIWKYKFLVLAFTIIPPILALMFLSHKLNQSKGPTAIHSASATIHFSTTLQTDPNLGYMYFETLQSNKLHQSLIKSQKTDILSFSKFASKIKPFYDFRSKILKIELIASSPENAVENLQNILNEVDKIHYELGVNTNPIVVDPPFSNIENNLAGSSLNKKKILFLSILTLMGGFFTSICLSLGLNFISKLRSDPEILKRITSTEI